MSLPAGTPIGKYVVRRKIAEGGMAEIFLAKAQGPEGFEKDVVIKRIRSYLADDPGFVQMFIAEARLASRLNHANLVQIFDFDKHEDTFYLAMEYVRGPSLWDVRKKSKERMEPMPSTLVAQIGAEVARGLHHAHRLTEKGKPLNLVHRDVTPHNVLLSYEGAVKLTDFGVAKAGNSKTAAGVLKGKFAYMSPEQSRGEEVDARTDVFALGIVLWEMLTGGRLFDGDSDVAVLRAVQMSQIAPPARLNPDISAELDAVVMKALERDPARRYQTAQEMERALAQYVMRTAKSLDDTDLPAYLRKLFQEEGSVVSEGHRDETGSGPAVEPHEPVQNRKREPTAVLGKPNLSAPVSPDEDVNAQTHVVVSAPQRAATPAQGTPSRSAAQGPAFGVLVTPEPVRAPRVELAPARVLETPAPAQPPPPQAFTPARPASLAANAMRVLGALALVAVGGGLTFALTQHRSQEPLRPTVTAPLATGTQAGTSAPTTAPIPAAAQAPSGSAVPSTGATDAHPVQGPLPAPTSVASSPGTPTAAVGSASPAPVQPTPGGPAKTGTVPAPGAAPGAVAPAAAPPALTVGTLVLKVTPWAMVSIDGKKAVEVTSKGIFKLTAGSHHVRLEHSRDVRELNVSLEDGKRLQREVSFLH